MSDGWLQRTKDGILWRVNNPDAYTKALKEGFTACEAPEIVPVYPAPPPGAVESEPGSPEAAQFDTERLRRARR